MQHKIPLPSWGNRRVGNGQFEADLIARTDHDHRVIPRLNQTETVAQLRQTAAQWRPEWRQARVLIIVGLRLSGSARNPLRETVVGDVGGEQLE